MQFTIIIVPKYVRLGQGLSGFALEELPLKGRFPLIVFTLVSLARQHLMVEVIIRELIIHQKNSEKEMKKQPKKTHGETVNGDVDVCAKNKKKTRRKQEG